MQAWPIACHDIATMAQPQQPWIYRHSTQGPCGNHRTWDGAGEEEERERAKRHKWVESLAELGGGEEVGGGGGDAAHAIMTTTEWEQLQQQQQQQEL